MKTIRKFSMAVVLTLAFATYGFAGIMPTVPGPEPPPPDNQTGIITTPPQSESASTDIEFALSILQSLLATF